MWVVHLISLFLYTLAFSVNFYTVICYHWLLGVNQLGYFVSLCFGWMLWWQLGYSLWQCIYGSWVWPTWNQFQFLLGALSTSHFCLEINFAVLHCIWMVFWQILWQFSQFFSIIGSRGGGTHCVKVMGRLRDIDPRSRWYRQGPVRSLRLFQGTGKNIDFRPPFFKVPEENIDSRPPFWGGF